MFHDSMPSALAQVPGLVEPVERAAPGLSPGGWVFMIVSLTFVWGFAICCYRRLLSSPKQDDSRPAERP